jgi:hypothetical protein
MDVLLSRAMWGGKVDAQNCRLLQGIALGEGELILSQTVAKLNRFWQIFCRKVQFLFFFRSSELQSICDSVSVRYMRLPGIISIR